MKDLYLHIGSHKTGSSALQETLYNNRSLLAPVGIHDLRVNPVGAINNGGVIGPPHKYLEKDFRQKGAAIGSNAARKILCAASSLEGVQGDVLQKIIFSSENLSWVFSSNEIDRFCGQLRSGFDRIRLVIYVRAQDKQLRAHHRQGVIDPLPRLFYGTDMGPNIQFFDHFDRYLNYESRISPWVQALGSSNVIVRAFERKLLFKEDISCDFLKLLGCPSELFESLVLSKDSNLISRRQERVLRKFQDLIGVMHGMPLEKQKRLKRRIRGALANKKSRQSDPLSNEFSRFLLDRYFESNKNLSERFSLGDSWYQYAEQEQEQEQEQEPEQEVNGVGDKEFDATVKILLKLLIKSEMNVL